MVRVSLALPYLGFDTALAGLAKMREEGLNNRLISLKTTQKLLQSLQVRLTLKRRFGV
jgi:hypothetical protein